MKIYLASSWRNELQPEVLALLRSCGHEVYDFRNPPNRSGFSWRTIHPDWENWSPEQYREALQHPLAKAGFESDMQALRECDACVLLLPSGRSASFEFGWAIGAGKVGAVVMFDKCEPELMYLGNAIVTSREELRHWAQVGMYEALYEASQEGDGPLKDAACERCDGMGWDTCGNCRGAGCIHCGNRGEVPCGCAPQKEAP